MSNNRPYTHTILKGDAAQPYYWHTKAGNGEIVASSHDQYTAAAAALHGLDLFASNAADAPINDRTASDAPGRLAAFEFEIDHDRQDRWIWRFQAGNSQIVATGAEPFSSKRSVLDAIERVKAHVADAEVVDETGEPVDIEACAAGNVRPPRARRYRIRVDREKYVVDRPCLTGREVLETAGRTPANQFQLYQKERGGQKRAIAHDETVDLARPGVERFQTIELTVTDGSPPNTTEEPNA
jgi:uncharacterized protein YegP (UPF0339 family)